MHAFDIDRTRRLPVHAGVRRARGHVRARQGHRAVGHRRQALPRLPVGHRRHRRSATPTRSSPRRSPPRPRTLLHVSNFFANPHVDGGGDRDQRAARRGHRPVGQIVLHQLGRRGQRVRAEAGPQVRRPRPPRRRQRASAASTAARSRRSPPPASRPSTSRSCRCPRASSTSRGATSTRCEAAVDATVGGRADRAGPGRGRRDPGATRLPRRRSASSATSTGR